MAMALQFVRGALVNVQVNPESVEMQMAPPLPRGPLDAAAASFVPSADEAMELQLKAGALFDCQVSPASPEV
jgi:hypothetical protein